MKKILRFTFIIILSAFFCGKMFGCTSFAVYSGEIWYGMNFDYSNVDIKFSITHIGNKKVFMAKFGSNEYIAGFNNNGLFNNYQELYYNNGIPKFAFGPGALAISNLNDYSIDYLSTVNEITNYIGSRLIVPSWGENLHSLFADSSGNAIVVEPFGSYNGITSVKDSFIVMTNFPNYDFIGMDYSSVHGTGDTRYKTAYSYVNEHKSSFSYNDGFETLKRTIQTSGSCPTQLSMLFDPVKKEIYICMKMNFSKVWKVSLENETVETFSGFSGNKTQSLNSNGLWSYQLPDVSTGNDDHIISQLNNEKIKTYPNPSLGKFEVSFETKPASNVKVEIFNIEGELILSKAFINTTNISFDLKGNPKGIYLIKLLIDGKLYREKICIE
ncbi:MAG: T9SS type A sorting domain-containing protein [Bacteroidota bacterium]|nr:T9SS type A sorting domain-containing protein [Bacteroidota bacterium]